MASALHLRRLMKLSARFINFQLENKSNKMTKTRKSLNPLKPLSNNAINELYRVYDEHGMKLRITTLSMFSNKPPIYILICHHPENADIVPELENKIQEIVNPFF